MDPLLQLQNNLAAKINAEPYFQFVPAYTYRSMVVSQEIGRRLPFLTGQRGKMGCGIVVNMPEISNVYANVDPPISEFSISIDVIENPELNFLPTGSRLTCEEVARQVRMLLNLFHIGLPTGSAQGSGSLYSPDKIPVLYPLPDVQAIYPGCCGYRVVYKLQMSEPQQARTVEPSLSEDALIVTLSDNQPGGGSTLWFTSDGSFPGPSNNTQTLPGEPTLTAQPYTAPFAVNSGTTVSIAAYYPGALGSNVGTYVIT